MTNLNKRNLLIKWGMKQSPKIYIFRNIADAMGVTHDQMYRYINDRYLNLSITQKIERLIK